MDYQEKYINIINALNELEFDKSLIPNIYINLNLEDIKKQFKKVALKYHPDKNGNTEQSTEKFKKINECYNYLKIIYEGESFNDLNNQEKNEKDENNFDYYNLLKSFIKSTFNLKDEKIDITKIIEKIINKGKQISIRLFEDLDKECILSIYTFLSKYKDILYIKDELLEEIKDICIHKFDRIQIFKLNPKIDDLLNHNLYKLYLNDNLFLVPLWIYKSYFDNSGSEIIVFCEPELPENVIIDDDNNLIIHINLTFEELFNKKSFNIKEYNYYDYYLGNKKLSIPIDDLYIRKEQLYIFKNQGLIKLKKDICDISEKMDIIFKIILN